VLDVKRLQLIVVRHYVAHSDNYGDGRSSQDLLHIGPHWMFDTVKRAGGSPQRTCDDEQPRPVFRPRAT
jgi:hypothetical protein